MPSLDYELIVKEDSIDNLNGLPPRFGFDFDVDITMENSGRWMDFPNEKVRLWQLEIDCPGALSINLLYDKFYIPEGGKFYIYSPDKKKKLGAFTQRNNKGDKVLPGAFATSLILNEKIIMEYYEPYNSNEAPIISVNKVVHGYRYITPFNFGDSDNNCEININCATGANWQDEKTSVALIVVGGTRWCTGSLINNTAGDGAPYLLTANHCLNGLDAISNPTASTWTFLWNYESPTCDNGTDFIPPSTAGATVVANNSASDFALLELDESPFDLTPSLCLFYNGWDKSGSTPSNSTSIHHPAGDIKKISVSNSSPSSDGNYWNVTFNQGIVEGGSSGSPLFNENSRVIGQLLGTPTNDPISCQNSDGLAVYGKFSVSWNNSTDQRRRLKDWLDPLGTNPNTLDGAYLFPTNNNNISGSSLVCSWGTSFTINDPPQVDSIVWTPGPNLTISSGQNSSICVFSAIGNSNSWIRARLVTDCASITLPQINVVAGSPQPGTISIEMDAPIHRFTATIQDVSTATSYNWYLNGVMNTTYHGSSAIFNRVSPYCGGQYQVQVEAINPCGTSAKTSKLVYEPSCFYSMVLSPNPTESESTITLSNENDAIAVSDKEWELEIYSSDQLLKMKQPRLKGKEYKINTSGWKDGVYIIKVKIEDQTISDKLVVKH